MKFLIVSSFFIHILFLLSIFYIYFKSIIIPGLKPQKDLFGAPAKRIVLFVADGLRAESFFKFGCNRTVYLRDVLLKQGIVRFLNPLKYSCFADDNHFRLVYLTLVFQLNLDLDMLH